MKRRALFLVCLMVVAAITGCASEYGTSGRSAGASSPKGCH